jgi:hypothetical protein
MPDVEALRAAGIIPVFSSGNEGELGTASVGFPGTYPNVLGVGATDANDVIGSFSGRGPSFWDEIKPEVSAPGVSVRSSLPGGEYGNGTGTSMAAPHVTGLIALMLQATRLSHDVEGFLKLTADRTLARPDTAGAHRLQAVRWATAAGCTARHRWRPPRQPPVGATVTGCTDRRAVHRAG